MQYILCLCLYAGLLVLGTSHEVLANKKAAETSWGGSIAGGLHVATGNTQSEDLNLDGKLRYHTDTWKHRGRLQAFNKKENRVRTDEEYRANFRSARKLSDKDDIFIELEYIDDRFSGYDYRMSELMGYNRYWFKQDDFDWKSSAAVGFQQTKDTLGNSENAPLVRFQNDVRWDINERVEFENTVKVDVSDINIFFTETGLKTQLHESLYLRLAFQTETLSEVPAGRKKTDTDTMINIGYDF